MDKDRLYYVQNRIADIHSRKTYEIEAECFPRGTYLTNDERVKLIMQGKVFPKFKNEISSIVHYFDFSKYEPQPERHEEKFKKETGELQKKIADAKDKVTLLATEREAYDIIKYLEEEVLS